MGLLRRARSARRPTPEEYGHGSIEGVADAGAANNSALAGAWVPALILGIPGDSITAIVLGIMMMKNLQPGPEIFEKQAVLVHSLYLVFVLANIALIPAGWLAIRASGILMRVPRHTLLPIIVLFCVLGAYAIGGSYFDVGAHARDGRPRVRCSSGGRFRSVRSSSGSSLADRWRSGSSRR